MSEAIGIGSFQFENLIRNRIPFLLVALDVRFNELYSGQELAHIERHIVSKPSNSSWNDILQTVKEKTRHPQDAILVICPTGETSRRHADALGKEGYFNTYFVIDGYGGLESPDR